MQILTTEAELVTQRLDSPAKFTFTCIQQGVCGIEAGNHVSFAVGGVPLFKGYVFTIEQNQGWGNYLHCFMISSDT